MIHLDLFSGCGGFAQGIKKAGVEVKTHYFSEVDKYAIANYQYNYPEAKHVGSVTNIRGGEIERPNIVTFGSPCQDFSIAGKRKGIAGERSSLISEAIRLVSECRPDYFIWENVKGAFSSNNSEDFWAIIKSFTNIGGYRLEWQLLNTKWLLPQNRERVYLVGHLGGGRGSEVFPIREDEEFFVNRAKNKPQTKHASCIGTGEGRKRESNFIVHEKIKKITSKNSQGARVAPSYSCGVTLSAQGGGLGAKTGLYSFDRKVKSSTKLGYELATKGDSISLSFPKSKTRRGRVGQKACHTLTTTSDIGVIIDDFDIRRLTPIECERLQGFDDDWTKYGMFDNQKKEISDTQRYKLTGNAVTVDVVKLITERLLK